ncbi:MAG: NDP-sugar synthase [bacterium]
MRAMLLCAGLGVRLRPLTNEIPKPLLPLFGRSVADYQLEAIAAAGAEAIVMNLHHLPDAVRERFGSRSRGLDILYSHEPEILGPTGGIRKALPALGDGPVLVVNGDVVMDIDYREMLKYHEETKAALTLAVGPGKDRPAIRAVGVDPEGRVRQIWRKPDWNGETLAAFVNLGAFVYDKRVIEEYIPENMHYDFRDQLMPRLFECGEKVMGYRSETYWSDIGAVDAYIQAHLDVFAGGGTKSCRKEAMQKAGDAKVPLKEPFFVEGKMSVGENASVGPNVALGSGCEIGAGSVLSNGVVLPGARVKAGTTADHFVAMGDRIVFAGDTNK